jgi:lysophospholipase L1-like esterase
VDVTAAADAYTVVAFGDSITNGFATMFDANRAWPTLLAERLSRNKATRNVSALARFDRDVLSPPG